MIEFTPYASSSEGNCYRITSGPHRPLLIDAGISYAAIQRGTGFSVTDLAAAIISHAHGDHSRAVIELMRRGTDVYASEGTWTEIERRRNWTPQFRPHKAKTIKARQEFTAGDWVITPFEAVHDQDGTLGFFIAAPEGGRLLYLTDTCYSPVRFRGLTHIVIEANYDPEILRDRVMGGGLDPSVAARTMRGHMSIDTALDLLMANDLSQVVAIHLIHLSDGNANEAEFARRVRRATGKPVFVAPKQGALA